MLVCPSCRSDNAEDAGVCRHCGTSLEAVGSPLRRRTGEPETESQLELWQPRSPSALPLIIGVLIVGLGLLGWGLFSALKPNPCAGRFSSSLAPYCLDLPADWAGGLFPVGDTVEDRFVPATAEGEAWASVRVSQIFDPTVGTPQYVQQFRTSQEATGLEISEADLVTLDGEEALAWNYSVSLEGEEAPHRVREVILVRGDTAWRIRLIASDETYVSTRVEFDEMLAEWRWKV